MYSINESSAYSVELPKGMAMTDISNLQSLPQNKKYLIEASKLSTFLNETKDWKAAHLQTQAFLAQLKGNMLDILYSQIYSQKMLKDFLLNDKVSTNNKQAIQEATAFYLESLAMTNNFRDYQLFAKALLSLDIYWSKDKITSIAKQCLEYRGPKKNPERFQVTSSSEMAQLYKQHNTSIPHVNFEKKIDLNDLINKGRNKNIQFFMNKNDAQASQQAAKTLAILAGAKIIPANHEDFQKFLQQGK
jgi:hypothetical protein